MKTNYFFSKFYSSILITFFIQNAYAQYSSVPVESKQYLVDEDAALSTPIQDAEFIGFRNPPSLDLKWLPIVTPKQSGDGNENYSDMVPDPEQLKKIKNEWNKKQNEQDKIEKRKNGAPENNNSSTAGASPVLGKNFGTMFDSGSGSPTDNSVAISNGGWIVSMINAKVCYANEQGVLSYTQTLKTWINDPVLPANQFLCDPVIIYDSQADRFVSFVKTCDNSTSYIILGFSKTNDPNAGWYFYRLTGNPLNDNSWGDLPKMAVSNEEVFVAINLYINNTNWNKAVVYQVSKKSAYAGQTPKFKVWNSFTGNPFTLTPLGWGQQGNYGPGIYIISSGAQASGSSNLMFYQITDTLNAVGATVKYYSIPVTTFSASSNAAQLGTSTQLSSGDCRAKSGFYMNGIVHFVFNSNYSGGYTGINYVRLDVKTTTPTMKKFGSTGKHYAYGAVSSFGSDVNDKSVIIGCDYVDANSYPGMKAIFCDDNMNFNTIPIDIKVGESYVKYPSSSSPERWGDYSGAWRKCNGSSVWLAGMYGRMDHYWGQWLAEIKDITSGANQDFNDQGLNINLFPNPAVEVFTLDFSLPETKNIDISLTDVQGRLVKKLYAGSTPRGRNTLSFNKANLITGIYFINISDIKGVVLKTKKIIIN